MKRLAILVFLSVTVQASEIEQLIDKSNSIKNTFDLGIRTVGGQLEYAVMGGISPDMASNAHLTYEQADQYNQALSAMKSANYEMTAQEYFDQQADIALDNLGLAVDSYVEASTQLVSAVQVNDMASQAETSDQVTELQTYIENNDLNITNEQVDTYNDSLDMVEQTAQVAASFIAVANDANLVASAQSQADDLNQSFNFAEESFYNQGAMTITLSQGEISLDLSGYLKSASDILAMGESSTFYNTSPTGYSCFFNPDECID